jgi:RHS repeat-associated protein
MQSAPGVRLLNPGDSKAMGTYEERYLYDGVGNILELRHRGTGPNQPGWKRCYQYASDSNRLLSTGDPSDPRNPDSPCAVHYAPTALLPEKFEYDAHGNMTRMPHLPRMTWDEHDSLQSTTRQVVNAGMPETTYYAYDGAGQRVRKATAWQAAQGVTPTRKSERIYLGPFEIYREYSVDGTTVSLERETLHVMDDKQRVAIVETRTTGMDDGLPQLLRYQYANHLGSAVLELDEQAVVISYEEYFPYGSTSYQAVRNQTETPKRYRYTGKERDEENDLYYHGARYYVPWLGRWTSPDPIGTRDDINVFAFVANNSVRYRDPKGLDKTDEAKKEFETKFVAGVREASKAIHDAQRPFVRPTGVNERGVATGRFDLDFWDLQKVGDTSGKSGAEPERVLVLREGKSAAAAIDAIVKHPEKWTFECASFAQVVELNGLRRALGDKDFDKFLAGQKSNTFGEIMLRQHGSTGLTPVQQWQHSNPRDPKSEFQRIDAGKAVAETRKPEDVIKTLGVGAELDYQSLTLAAKKPTDVFRFENAIKIGPDKYIAFPFGEVSDAEIRDALWTNAEGKGFKSSVKDVRIESIERYTLP